MRYALNLMPDIFLLIALLRMTGVYLHTERRALFAFLAAWLLYSFVTLFLAQIWPADSHEYKMAFLVMGRIIWFCAMPAAWLASRALVGHKYLALAGLGIAAIAGIGVKLALLNHEFSWLTKHLAINAWIAVPIGSIFLFASMHAESPDRLLWRCTGIFFLIYGFGYLFIGMANVGVWAYAVVVIAGAAVWLGLAWHVGPHPDHLFNLEKLALIPAAYRVRAEALARRRHA